MPTRDLLLGSCTSLRPSQLAVAEWSPAATVPEVLPSVAIWEGRHNMKLMLPRAGEGPSMQKPSTFSTNTNVRWARECVQSFSCHLQ